MKRKGLFCLLLVLAVAFGPAFAQKGQPGKRPWGIRDGFRMSAVRDLEISPDEAFLAFTVTERNSESFESTATLWLMPLGGGAPKAALSQPGAVSNPKWSPDGKRIAFFAAEEGRPGLWVMNRDGSNAKKLVDIEKSNAYVGMKGNEICWSPDSAKIAYNAAGPRFYSHHPPTPLNPPTGNDVMVIERLQFKAFYYYSDMRRTHVFVVSADGGKPEQISSGEYDYHSITWSPDGKQIACISNRTGRDDYDSNNDICILSVEGKPLVQLTRTPGPEYWPVWSPDGSRIAYLNRLRGRRSKESDAEQHKVFVIPAAGGETRRPDRALGPMEPVSLVGFRRQERLLYRSE